MIDKPRLYVVPKSCWQPRITGIPADEQMHPAGCPDPDWCRGNRFCYWHCKNIGCGADIDEDQSP